MELAARPIAGDPAPATTPCIVAEPRPQPSLPGPWQAAALATIEADIAAHLDGLPAHSPLSAPIRYALQGGKRFRALLVRAACEAVGGDPAAARGAALAVEMVQAQSLILDDLPCMDDAQERRGRPALHRAFGEPVALLAAATLLCEAYAALARDGVADLDRKVAALSAACGAEGIAHGQAAELCGLPESVAKKTAPLLAAAARLGAIAGGCGDDFRLAALAAFADEIGLAYQLRDDMLDGDREHELAGRTAERAVDRALIRLSHAGLDTPVLRALAREAVRRGR